MRTKDEEIAALKQDMFDAAQLYLRSEDAIKAERDAAQRECSRLREEVRRLTESRDYWSAQRNVIKEKLTAAEARVAALEEQSANKTKMIEARDYLLDRLEDERDEAREDRAALAARVEALEGALRHTSQLQHFYPAPCSECDAARALLASPPAASTPAPDLRGQADVPLDFTCSTCKRPLHGDTECEPGYPGDPRATPAPQTAEQGIPSGPHPLDESGG